MRVHIYDGRSLIGEGEYDPQRSVLTNVSHRGKPLTNHTVTLISKMKTSLSFTGKLKPEGEGFLLEINPQT